MLRLGWLLGWGNKYDICSFGYNCNQYIHFRWRWQCSPVIVKSVRLRIIETVVMLIFGCSDECAICHCRCQTDQYTHLRKTRQESCLVVKSVGIMMVDAPLMLMIWMGQGPWHLPFRLSYPVIHSLWKDETIQPFDCRLCKTTNRWHSVDAHIQHIKEPLYTL